MTETHDRKTTGWRREPLLHFVLIGIIIFLLYNLFGSGDGDDEYMSKTIVIDRNSLLEFVQYRTKRFGSDIPGRLLDNMSEKDLNRIIGEYAREEALYREAVALGLDGNDYIIRRRLIQKLEFINRDLSSEIEELTESQARGYFDEHRDDYYISPVVTFTHAFFDSRKRGRSQARKLAEIKLAELNENQVPFDEGARHGERFLYYVNYVERPPEFVASHFGPEMAEAVLKLSGGDHRWYGPYESPYGFHLVMMAKNIPGRTPEFDEIADRVKENARQASINDKSEAIIKEIVDSYKLKITYKPAKPATNETFGGKIRKSSQQKGADVVKDSSSPITAERALM